MRVESYELSIGSMSRSTSLEIKRESIRFLKDSSRREEGFSFKPLRLDIDLSQHQLKEEDIKDLIVRRLVELLTGKKIKTLSFSEITSSKIDVPEIPPTGVEYRREELKVEAGSLSFYAYGEIRTSDGKSVRFQLSMSLLNVSVEINRESIRAGDIALIDPLVIDLSGSPKMLSSSKFSFDLDGDGEEENIPLLAGGKGFIFFDQNENNVVDNGREIVGVRTGDAFRELSSLDEDKNGWIDEGDTAFSSLKVWLKNENTDRVLSLKELGIGALYTGSETTSFTFTDFEGNLTAILRNASVYLTEKGEAGALYKIDFAV